MVHSSVSAPGVSPRVREPPVRAAGTALASLEPVRLRCEYLVDPAGIDALKPRLSWGLAARDPSSRCLKQSAYRIIVARDQGSLDRGDGNLWDSGKIASDATCQIAYAGERLGSGAPCYWKVQIWDEQGRPPGWSSPARWTMGMLSRTD